MEVLFESIEFILSKIAELIILGFDQIRIPGGSSKDESHYSGIFFYCYDKKTKEIYFLGVPYNSSHWRGNDSNGHTKKYNENSLETACREGFEETGYVVKEEDLVLVSSYSIPDRKDKTKTHTKYFYATDKFSGHLHDFDGANLIDKETAAPMWISSKTFKNVLYGGHQKAFLQAIEYLKNQSADLYYALENI